METDLMIDTEISPEEEMTNCLSNTIREIFENAGEVIIRVGSVTPHNFLVITEGADPSRITWAPKFVIVHIPSEKPVLIETFTEAIGFGPFSRYIENGLLVFEWDWADSKVRFAELEREEKMERIEELQRIG